MTNYNDYLKSMQSFQTPLLCKCSDCPFKCERFTPEFRFPYNYIIGKPFTLDNGKFECKYKAPEVGAPAT